MNQCNHQWQYPEVHIFKLTKIENYQGLKSKFVIITTASTRDLQFINKQSFKILCRGLFTASSRLILCTAVIDSYSKWGPFLEEDMYIDTVVCYMHVTTILGIFVCTCTVHMYIVHISFLCISWTTFVIPNLSVLYWQSQNSVRNLS